MLSVFHIAYYADLFAFKLGYNEGGTPLYNGNIAFTQWKTANTDNSLKTYTYTYDALNRLSLAADNLNRYNENLTYDKNGNILTLNRNGHTNAAATTFGVMDNLTYTYANNNTSNKLIKVEDASTSTEGFKNGVNTAVEYTYDVNGNMTRDDNKGITNITYNHLNLPTQVTMTIGTISYIYDATGVKQRKTVSTGTGTTTDYAGNYVYENNTLQFFNQPEGYVEPTSDVNKPFQYVYQYKDHLGNIRLSYNDKNNDGVITVSTDPYTNELVEENNYYPFGLKHKGYNNNQGAYRDHKYEYANKELEEDLGLNTIAYGWRDYDPAIARFNKVDRFAEKYFDQSPYHFTQNNPIRFQEVAGDSIWIRYKGDRILYENGKLYSRGENGKMTAYNGKGLKTKKDGTTELKGFLGKTVSALDAIRNGGSSGLELVGDLQKASKHFFIEFGDNANSVNNVFWNPSSENGGPNEEGGTGRPPYVGLAHELGHLHDWLDGKPDDSIIGRIGKKNIQAAEFYAMYWENRIRQDNQISLRTHYGVGNNNEIIGPAIRSDGSFRQAAPSIQTKIQSSPIGLVPITGSKTIVIPIIK